MGHRKINFIFIFTAIALFVLEAGVDDRYQLLLALALSIGVSFTVYLVGLLTIDGARASIMLGLIAFGFGGLEAAVIVIAFFASSNIIGLPFGSRKGLFSNHMVVERRNGSQVWGNGFWFAIFVCVWFVMKADMFFIAALGAIATASADTWGTEVGSRSSGKAVLITTRETVEAGTDGGISLLGTIASLAGALFIASVSLIFDKNYLIAGFIAVAAGGFIGSLVDSWLGAVFQYGNKRLPNLLDSYENRDNNSVNFLATGIGALLTLIIYNILIYGMV